MVTRKRFQEELLKLAFSKLKDNGKIILATDNRRHTVFNGRKDCLYVPHHKAPRQPMLSELKLIS